MVAKLVELKERTEEEGLLKFKAMTIPFFSQDEVLEMISNRYDVWKGLNAQEVSRYLFQYSEDSSKVVCFDIVKKQIKIIAGQTIPTMRSSCHIED